MARRTTIIDIHMKSLDYLEELKGIDIEATDEHIAATAATILYLLLKDKKGE